MISLAYCLKCFDKSEVKTVPFLYFKDSVFCNKVLIFGNTQGSIFEISSKAHSFLVEKDKHTEKHLCLDVYDIKIWDIIYNNSSFSIGEKRGMSRLENKASAEVLDIFQNLKYGVLKEERINYVIEIDVSIQDGFSLLASLMQDVFISSRGFRGIFKQSKRLLTLDFDQPKDELAKIKSQKRILDRLIREKLDAQHGKLKGIRESYSKNKINLLFVTSFYNLGDINSYEVMAKNNWSSFGNKTNTVEKEFIPQSATKLDSKQPETVTHIATNTYLINQKEEQRASSIIAAHCESFDIFEFSNKNGRVGITINKNHNFYTEFYSKLNPDAKIAVELLISSMIKTNLETSITKIREQDKAFFTRWSEFVEVYGIKDSNE